MGTIYIVQGDTNLFKVGYFDDGGTIDNKIQWLEGTGVYSKRRGNNPYKNYSWTEIDTFTDSKIDFDVEQDIHKKLKNESTLREDAIMYEVYHGQYSTISRIVALHLYKLGVDIDLYGYV